MRYSEVYSRVCSGVILSQALLLTIAFVQDWGVLWGMGISRPKLRRFWANQYKFIPLLGFLIHPISGALAPTFVFATDMEFQWAWGIMHLAFFSRWHLEINKTYHSRGTSERLWIILILDVLEQKGWGWKTKPTYWRKTEWKVQTSIVQLVTS